MPSGAWRRKRKPAKSHTVAVFHRRIRLLLRGTFLLRTQKKDTYNCSSTRLHPHRYLHLNTSWVTVLFRTSISYLLIFMGLAACRKGQRPSILHVVRRSSRISVRCNTTLKRRICSSPNLRLRYNLRHGLCHRICTAHSHSRCPASPSRYRSHNME